MKQHWSVRPWFVATAAVVGALTLSVPPTGQAETFTCTAGDVGCIIASMGKANVSPDHDYLILKPGTYLLTKPDNTPPNDAPNGLPVNTGALTIVGEGGQGRTLLARAEGAPPFRLLDNAPTGGLTIAGVTLAHGEVGDHRFDPKHGGCVRNQGSMMLVQSTVRECTAWMGGGIYSNGELLIQRSVIMDNLAHVLCGGIAARGPTIVERNTWIGENVAESGGGICGGAGTPLTIRGSVVDGNVATAASGGGIVGGDALEVTQSLVSENVALAGGGIVAGGAQPDTLRQSTLWGNLAAEVGGGIVIGPGEVHLENVAVLFNKAGNRGRGPGDGGGMAVAEGGVVVLERSWLLWNEAGTGAQCSGEVQLESWNVIGDAGRFHRQDEAPCQ